MIKATVCTWLPEWVDSSYLPTAKFPSFPSAPAETCCLESRSPRVAALKVGGNSLTAERHMDISSANTAVGTFGPASERSNFPTPACVPPFLASPTISRSHDFTTTRSHDFHDFPTSRSQDFTTSRLDPNGSYS